uniref:transposase n=1 Tax=Wolbachia endosymbiont (group A) of Lasioglossum malachurum TaxID=2954024 RepID=UPI0021F9183F|nr:transposase [Wolbachia endosymbiont (group A) of Lasioglossum malachurum]
MLTSSYSFLYSLSRQVLRRKFKIKKQQTDNRAVAPNILDQNFIVDQPNKVWDYLHQNQGGMAIFGSNNSHVW